VMMEYTIAAFTPVILASVAATIMSRAVFGAGSVFYVPQLDLATMWDLLYILLWGSVLAHYQPISSQRSDISPGLVRGSPAPLRLLVAESLWVLCQ
jgi:H+/Cl- antiporter ClcA